METPATYQIQQSAPMAMSMFATAEAFALLQRQAQLFAASDLIPKQFQGNVANCAIALEMAARLGASPFAVIQNLEVIHGRPSWRAVFLMGLVNNCGRFTPLQFKLEATGDKKTVALEFEDWDGPQGARKKVVRKLQYTYTPTRCVAWARDRASGEVIEGPPVSYDMAIEEGWVTKAGSKWQTEMREVMLRYRAASFFAKVYASDVMLGMQTSDELIDAGPPMRDATPHPAESIAKALQPADSKPAPDTKTKDAAPEPAAPEHQAEDAEVIPPRVEMVKAITAVMRERGLQSPAVAAHFRKLGMVTQDRLNQCEDMELFAVFSNLELMADIATDEPQEDKAP